MNALLNTANRRIGAFLRDDEGAQVVEYALIIAVVSIILVVALRNLTGTSFSGFISRVEACLTGGTCA
ncbi:Flp family type IVb pilin [Massilia atriviolacea]|uniref:Flp family type IVb pilin n=1 Tax=Massilia atriviolacea TaxID=2495579 RepID=A0A430HD47_9BURK|nr:Flp family type IVb pilin [Massilia atriviolacea]RSZ55432.1 Flp family type IVb pilin [Massilia atriviolacea]